MLRAYSYEEIIEELNSRLEGPKIVGLLFARPGSQLTTSEVLPNLEYFHNRSEQIVHFLCIGYGAYWDDRTNPDKISLAKIDDIEWLFSTKKFNQLRKRIEQMSSWRYSGEVDLVLLNVKSSHSGELNLDFQQYISYPLYDMKQQGTIDTVAMFFERIFRFADNCTGNNELQDLSSQIDKRENSFKTKILFIASEPTDADNLRIGTEMREIQTQLQLAKLRDSFEISQRWAVRPGDLSQALLDIEPDFVHFSGHGLYDGAICLEDEYGQLHQVKPDVLASLLREFANKVVCVVLNACHSKIQANAIAQAIPNVIGMESAINDESAIAFSIGFYQGIGAGRTIKNAYQLGKIQIKMRGLDQDSVPILISRE